MIKRRGGWRHWRAVRDRRMERGIIPDNEMSVRDARKHDKPYRMREGHERIAMINDWIERTVKYCETARQPAPMQMAHFEKGPILFRPYDPAAWLANHRAGRTATPWGVTERVDEWGMIRRGSGEYLR